MPIHKRKFNPEDDLGFGTQPVLKNQPLIRQDGSINVKRRGLPFYNTANNYHKLITMKWSKFWLMVLCGYFILNTLFAFIYLFIGVENLNGAEGTSTYQHFWDAFFFSAQTISTVGYGRCGIGVEDGPACICTRNRPIIWTFFPSYRKNSLQRKSIGVPLPGKW